MRKAVIALGLLAFVACTEPVRMPAISPLQDATVIKHTDGDTFRVLFNGRDESVRFIGIDTPERGDRFFDDASAFTARAAPLGTQVRLEFDVEERDRYGRLLAYVWPPGAAGDVDEMLNAQIVDAGWATTLTIPPNVRYADEFAERQRRAQSARRGMWMG